MIYLDNAATTRTKPPAVARAVLEALSSYGNCGRGGHEGALSAARTVYGVREKPGKKSPPCWAVPGRTMSASPRILPRR